MRFYLNPVESDDYPGFYLVPDIERLVVSKQGHYRKQCLEMQMFGNISRLSIEVLSCSNARVVPF